MNKVNESIVEDAALENLHGRVMAISLYASATSGFNPNFLAWRAKGLSNVMNFCRPSLNA